MGARATAPAALPVAEEGPAAASVALECEGTAGTDVPPGRSKHAHKLFNNKDIVFISFDIETAGAEVGVIQIFAVIFRLDLVRNKKTKGKHKGEVNQEGDTATNVRRDPEVFNKYV